MKVAQLLTARAQEAVSEGVVTHQQAQAAEDIAVQFAHHHPSVDDKYEHEPFKAVAEAFGSVNPALEKIFYDAIDVASENTGALYDAAMQRMNARVEEAGKEHFLVSHPASSPRVNLSVSGESRLKSIESEGA